MVSDPSPCLAHRTLNHCCLILPAEIKEHDPSPDPVLEEPHHQEGPLDREGPLDKEGDRISQTPQSSGHDNLGAVSGFLSGFAAAVQTTVSMVTSCHVSST